jgi:hypothetical protein
LSLRPGLATVAVLALGLGLAACGDDSGGGGTAPSTPATSPQATAPSAHEPPPDATGPSPAPPGGPEHTGRERDNGEEEPVRVDAQFVLRGGGLRPATVTTPSFLAVQLSVRNLDTVARVVVVRTDRDYRLLVGAGRRAARQIPGQPAGTYPVLVGGRRRGALVFGGEPGP